MTPGLGSSLQVVLVAATVVLATMAAVHDVIARTIPNGWCVAIAFAGLGARVIGHTLPVGLAAGAIVFVVATVCWRAGWLGGGDVKLLGACALTVPPHLVPNLVMDTSIAGALLALVYLAARNRLARPHSLRPAGLLARAWRAERWRLSRGGPLPYAVAIAVATTLVLIRGTVS